ncbi:MAG: hypothetical protein IPI49_12185 [Myxococcales bacterium]|nr:hypothetical protein [Myxococcales bacterium]
MAHQWHFFRAGGVDQVSLRDGADILALDQLDQKLWVALAMPTRDVDIDPATLDGLDVDKDGRIRVQDILQAVAWIKTTFKDAGKLLTSADSVALAQLADAKILATAKRMLSDLGKKDATSVSIEDATAITKAFSDTVLNGDGVVIPASSSDADLTKAIEDVVATHGGVPDRSGKSGVDKDKATAFFAEIDKMAEWMSKPAADAALRPLGEGTAAAAEALTAVAAKLEDYFTRCRLAAYDGRATAALAGQDADYQAMAPPQLSMEAAEIARLPLAAIDAKGRLPLTTGVNPAWAAKLATFVEAAVKPILGARDSLSAPELAEVTAKLGAYQAWLAAKPATAVGGLDAAWIGKLASGDLRKQLDELIASDAALAGDYAEIASVEKAVRLQRDFGRILRNFVNFSDFYGKQDAVFQAGTLYFDARAARLCVWVADEAKHGALAGAAGAYLAYCSITRGGETKHIACALTNGDSDNVFVGRNGIFYDRQGQDWDATVTKVVSNPISVREAFWSPYKKLIRTVEEMVGKRAEAAQAASDAKMSSAGTAIANVDATKPPEPKAEPKKIDVGTVAAIGVAIGGIGAMLGGIFGTVLGLGKWLPLGILGLLLAISGPSMAIAWLKLRKRNLGPILDANNWAVNGSARINVSFGAAMTSLAELPSGSSRSLQDPFADKRSPWKLYLALALLLAIPVSWYFGKLDNLVPQAVQSTTVLGERAPRWEQFQKAQKAKADAPAAAGAPAAPAADAPAAAPAPVETPKP